jgi:hypothetical protein
MPSDFQWRGFSRAEDHIVFRNRIASQVYGGLECGNVLNCRWTDREGR